MTSVIVQCVLCGIPSPSLKFYVSHLRTVHGKDPNFNVMCGINGCREVFRAYAAFNSHVYRHHRVALGLDTPIVTSEESMDASRMDGLNQTDDDIDSVLNEEDTVFTDQHDNVDPNTSPSDPMSQVEKSRSAAKLLLNLREGHQVSQVAIKDFIGGCRSLYSEVFNDLSIRTRDILTSNGVTVDSIPELNEVLGIPPDPFVGIDTDYLYEKFCREHLGYLEPQEIQLGKPYYVDKFTGSKRRKAAKVDTFCYVPLLENLKMLLSCEDILNEVLNPHQSKDGKYSDFCDGLRFQKHPLLSVDPYALQIIGYYDELEIVNPLGSYVKKQKLGCCFFVLANIRPQYRSTLKAISLVSVARYQDIVKYGIETFLTPFVEDLKTLYCNGVTVSISGEQHTFRGALLAFLADTLAAHSVGGFKQSMSFALRICRTCMATTDDLPKLLSDSECTMRTPETYFEQCSLLCGPLRDHYSTSFGINRISKLEEVPGFSVISGLPHDLMHDLFEGVVPYELKLLIKHCVSNKYYTIKQLNNRMARFDFPSDRPSDIDPELIAKDKKIRQSASQMMCLCHEFPMLVGDLIPESDNHWLAFLVLLKICAISLSPTCTPDTVAYLRVLIEEKLCLFKQLYSDEKFIPKQHYLVHYPSQIENLGPLINSWTMRHESKLSFVKCVSIRSNYKNVAKTVAKKHQFWVCYQMHRNRNFLRPSIEVSPKFSTVQLVTEADNVRQELLRLCPGLDHMCFVQHPSWVNLQNSHFCKGVFILLSFDIVRPQFGKIFDIITCNEIVLLCVQVFYGSMFCAHYNSYVIKSNGNVSVVPVHALVDHRPLRARESFVASDRTLYLSLPYYY